MDIVLHPYDLEYGYIDPNGKDSPSLDNIYIRSDFIRYEGNKDGIIISLFYDSEYLKDFDANTDSLGINIMFYNEDKKFMYGMEYNTYPSSWLIFSNNGESQEYTHSNFTVNTPTYLRLCIGHIDRHPISRLSIISEINVRSEYYFYMINGEIMIKGIPEVPESDIYPKGSWSVSPYTNYGLPCTGLMIPTDVKLPECDIPDGSWRISTYINDGILYTKLMIGLSVADTDVEYPFINLFDYVRVLSPPHGLDKLFPVSKIKIPLNSPEETEYTLSNNFTNQSLSSTSNKVNQDLYARIMAVPDKSTILNTAKENSSNLIKMATNGYVTLVQDEQGGTLEIVISSEPDYLQAQNVWRWNVNGLGFSSTGYNGDYGTAITMDGAIVADRITAGTMFADRIRGGTLVLGGYDNVNGVCKVVNENEETICELNCRGAFIKGQVDSINESNGLVCRMHNGRFSYYKNDVEVGFIDGTYLYEGDDNPSIYVRSNKGLIISSEWLGVTDSRGDVYSTARDTNIDIVTNISYNSDGQITGVEKRTLSFMKGIMMS